MRVWCGVLSFNLRKELAHCYIQALVHTAIFLYPAHRIETNMRCMTVRSPELEVCWLESETGAVGRTDFTYLAMALYLLHLDFCRLRRESVLRLQPIEQKRIFRHRHPHVMIPNNILGPKNLRKQFCNSVEQCACSMQPPKFIMKL